jgi:hypothetical protein
VADLSANGLQACHEPLASLSVSIGPALREVARVAYLFFPLLGGALGVGLCTRYDLWVAWPIDRGVTCRRRRLLGDNKTFRGILVGTLGTTPGMLLQGTLLHAMAPLRALEYADYSRLPLWRFGLLLGLARMLSELPNSFAKRQLHIAPGKLGTGRHAVLFYIIDHLDYLPAVWIVLSGFVPVTLSRVLVSILVVFLGHHLASATGYCLGMRKSIH